MITTYSDGTLDLVEALKALREAAEKATQAMYKAISKCNTEEDIREVVEKRDAIVLAYLSCLSKSLKYTGPFFEKTAKNLENAANEMLKDAQHIKDSIEAIRLFTETLQLSASLALAFA